MKEIPYNPKLINPIDEFLHNLLTYSYYERDFDSLIFCLDNSRFVNHSFNANSGASEDEKGFCAVGKYLLNYYNSEDRTLYLSYKFSMMALKAS